MPQANVPAPQATMPQANVPAPQATMPQAKQNNQPYYGPSSEGNQGEAQARAQMQLQNLPPDPLQEYIKLQDNVPQLIKYGYDETMPEALRVRAKQQAADLISQERGVKEAKEKLSTMTETELAKAMREKTSGGSYLKAMMFGLLGMENSALQEAAKLGIGKEQSVMLTDGTPAIIKIASNGTPISGYNATTGAKLSANELVAAQAGMAATKGTEVEAGTYMDPTGKVAGNWVLERKPGGSQYRQVGTGKIATEEQANSLRKTGVQGTLGDQRARQIQDINLKLQGKGVEEQMRILSDYNKQLVGAGFPIVQPSEVGINVPQISGGTTGQGAPAPAGATAGQGAPAPAGTSAPATSVSPAAVAASGQRPTINELEANKTRTKEAAQEEGVDLGKIKANQPKTESNADYLLTKIDEIVGNPTKNIKQHPGFETSVGAQGASYLFGLRDKPVAPQFGGGDARDFQNRMREISGQSFLQAIESLRGMGALSNNEGEAATRAIQRMGYVDKDGNLVITATEKEFKEAAKDFQDIIQRGVDRNRVKLGQKPKYGTPEASEKTKQEKNVQRKTIGNKTYVFDGVGWKEE